MLRREFSEKCKSCIDCLLDSKDLTQEQQQHMGSCPDCKELLTLVNSMKQEETAYEKKDYSALKSKIVNKLAKNLPQPTSTSLLSKLSTWALSLSLAGALLIYISFNISPTPPTPTPMTSTQIKSSIQTTGNYQISFNGKDFLTESLDNPVYVAPGDQAKIQLPDKSMLEVTGPTNLTIAERGFHIISGKLIAKVTKDKNNKFVGTTPHGTITVLGTIFTCNVTHSETQVSVKEGKVRVSPDKGLPIVLTAGESAKMQKSEDISTESGQIPPIDSE